MNIFKKLFGTKIRVESDNYQEHPWDNECSCKEDDDVDPVVKLYNEMYCFAATVADSEIEEGNVLAKDRGTEIDTHVRRMMFLYSEGQGEI